LAIVSHFIDGGGTKALAGIPVFFSATRGANVCVQHVQVSRLIFIVSDRRMIDIGDLIESKFVVES
jgi:hypothetical protein